MSRSPKQEWIPPVGPYVMCAAIPYAIEDGFLCYRAGPRVYFMDGQRVTEDVFKAHRQSEAERS